MPRRRHYAELGELKILSGEFSRSSLDIDPDEAGLGLR
jgi:hypothetical protein